jgi:hypothetical protein
MDLSRTNSSVNMLMKKLDKNDLNQKSYKVFQKSNEILRETTKNSYFNKYIEECNRAKQNIKKTSSLKQNKLRNDKDIHLYNQNYNNTGAITQKKAKNFSMDKNDNSFSNINNNVNNNNINNNLDKKKSVRHLSIDKVIKNEYINKKNQNNNFSIISNNETHSNNLSHKDKEREKEKEKIKKVQEKNDINNSNNSFQYNIPKITNLSNKENAYLLLSYSKILRLTERMIFARSTINLRRNLPKKLILEVNKKYLSDKLIEMEKKIEICNNKLNSKFTASKTAEMIFNFITLEIENDFKLNMPHIIEEEHEKNEYYEYIKLLYILLDESYDKIPKKNLTKQLYQKINNKGFSNIKDYLYFIYIKNLKENKVVDHADAIKKIVKDIPDFLNYHASIKYSKFITYCCYLIKEIISFANDKMDTLNLQKDCINLKDIINNKLNLYNEKRYINISSLN